MSTDFSPHNMTGNALPAPYVCSASSVLGFIWYAFDGSTNYWLSTNPVCWLKIDLGPFTKRTLSDYSIQVNVVPEPARAPKDFTMSGSVDDVTYDVLDTRTNETSWTSGETRNYVCNSATTTYYRYFRLDVSANNGDGTYTQVRELYLFSNDAAYYPQITPTTMSDNTTPSPYVASASSTFTASGEYVVYGSNAAVYWLGTNPASWHKIDIGSGAEKTLQGYIILVNSVPEAARAPKDWTLEGSNNNSTWDTLDTRTNQTSWGSGEWRAYTCNSPTGTAYRYYRVNITANNGDGTYVQLDKVFMYAQAAGVGASGYPKVLMFL